MFFLYRACKIHSTFPSELYQNENVKDKTGKIFHSQICCDNFANRRYEEEIELLAQQHRYRDNSYVLDLSTVRTI